MRAIKLALSILIGNCVITTAAASEKASDARIDEVARWVNR